MWGLTNLPQKQAPGPGTWNGFWTLSLTNEERKHPNIVLQQQVRNLHKEREGQSLNTGPKQPGSVLETSKSLEAGPSHNSISERLRDQVPVGRTIPGWSAGSVPHTPNTGKVPAPRRGSGRTGNVQRGGGRAGRGWQAPTACPLPGLPVPLHFALVEMKANCSQTAGPERAVNSLGSLTHVCRLLCQKGTR